jgi:Xaa-Pro aminopeptidase
MTMGLSRLINYLQANCLKGVIITKQENRRFFSGFTGSAGMLFISAQARCLLTDFRYIEQAQKQAQGFEIIQYAGAPFEALTKLCAEMGTERIGFEGDHVTWDTYQHMVKSLPGLELVPVRLDSLRSVKAVHEIELIRKAVQIADQAFEEVIKIIRPGIRETEVAAELEYSMRRAGAERPAFDTIVASGYRGALPHGLASAKRIEPGDFVTMDFGAVYEGYHSDITRTVVAGKASPKHKEIYDIVITAQLAGIEAVREGKDCRDVDNVARRIIANAGYGNYFGHGLGHSVGLAIHEEPRLSPSNSGVTLSEGMVVTVEPGIYLPGWGGVRIEDIVVVTPQGREILTASSKVLIELE